MRRDLLTFELAKDRQQALAAIEAGPGELQHLFWLSWLLRGWGPTKRGPPFDKALDKLTGLVDDGVIRPTMVELARRAAVLPQ